MRLREVKEIIKVALNEKKKEMLNEVDYEYQGASYNLWAFCSNCPCGCGDVIENCVSAGGQGYACATCKENCGDTTGTSATSNIALGGKTADNKFINRPRKPMRRKPMRRKPMFRKPMRLREVKEIIEVMLDEKKKKKKDRCHRKADQVYGTKTSAYKSGAIVKCRKGMIWKVGGKKKK
jgi:transposase-like protein